jgi:acyl-CoA thioesterase YciA
MAGKGKASHQPPGLALPRGKIPALRVVPMPADSNQNGDIFGGWIMAQVDVAGGTVASRVARGRVATVSVNSFVFKQPVQIGDVLSFYAELQRIGNTSVTVNVEVYAERGRADTKVVKVTEATLTYVAIDLDGKPRPVPKRSFSARCPRRCCSRSPWPPAPSRFRRRAERAGNIPTPTCSTAASSSRSRYALRARAARAWTRPSPWTADPQPR